jgi:hypothetical protein
MYEYIPNAMFVYMWDLHPVVVFLPNQIVTEPVYMNLGMCIVARETISTAYFINPLISLYVYMCILQPLLDNGWVKTPYPCWATAQ